MTVNAGYGILSICALWILLTYYFLFYRKKKVSVLVAGAITPKDDSEVIVSKNKIMINVVFAEEERELATTALLADFVISFKDIVNGTYMRPVTDTIASASPVVIDPPGEKEKDGDDEVGGAGEEGFENEDFDPALEPDLPEPDPSEAPIPTEQEESQLIDSNNLNLNMSNF